jgi:hypothetical protein
MRKYKEFDRSREDWDIFGELKKSELNKLADWVLLSFDPSK